MIVRQKHSFTLIITTKDHNSRKKQRKRAAFDCTRINNSFTSFIARNSTTQTRLVHLINHQERYKIDYIDFPSLISCHVHHHTKVARKRRRYIASFTSLIICRIQNGEHCFTTLIARHNYHTHSLSLNKLQTRDKRTVLELLKH